GLRNYGTHRQVLGMISEFRIDRDQGLSHKQYVPKEELTGWEGWNAAARSYLDTAPEKNDIGAVTKEYAQKDEDFYLWAFERLQQIHATDIAVVEAKRTEARAELGRQLSDRLRMHMRSTADGRPEEIFLGYIDPPRWRQLAAISDPRSRARAFVDEVK